MISLKQFSLLFWKRFSENKLNQAAGALTQHDACYRANGDGDFFYILCLSCIQ